MTKLLLSMLALVLPVVVGRAVEPWTFAQVRGFGFRDQAAIWPTGPLLRASDGRFYGVANRGLYRLESDGTGFHTAPWSPATATQGQILVGTLGEGPDGRLYGASRDSAGLTAGVLAFRPDGSGVQLLHRFEETNVFALWIVGEQLSVAADGSVFGQAWKDSTPRRALVFRLSTNGTREDLHELPVGFLSLFPATQRGVAADGNGALYGAAPNGGAFGLGILFRVQADGSGYSVLHEFGGADRDLGRPAGPLRRASDGNLYGIAASAFDSTNLGAIFRVTPAGAVTVMHRMQRGPDQPLPEGGLIESSDGRLYGTAQEDGLGIFSKIYRLNKDGSGFEIIYTSKGVSVGIAALAEGADGRFYTTSFQGPTDTQVRGDGSIFRINGDGSGFTNVWLFHRMGGDGQRPMGPILVGSDQKLYGTTTEGGTENDGTVFRVNRDGSSPQVLHSFLASETNGSSPFAGLIEGQDGLLYGVASQGGAHGRGTVFRISKEGHDFAVVHHFAATGDGANPLTQLSQATNGTLYGVTSAGGTNGTAGTVFAMDPDGSHYRVLHDFTPATESLRPVSALIVASDGELYGTTSAGGPANAGTVFALRLDGNGFRVLHTFATNAGAAYRPGAGALVASTNGRLYGTTLGGFGAVYRINRDGSGYSVVHRFTGGAGGQDPDGGLTTAPDGGLVGIARSPGPNDTNLGDGLLYRIDPVNDSFSILSSFRANSGFFASGHLAVGPDAALYSADQNGGELNAGQIYRLMPPDYLPRFVDGTAQRLASGAFTAQVVGTLSQSAVIESSDDFEQWNPVLPILLTGQPIVFTNTPAGNRGFYRMRVP